MTIICTEWSDDFPNQMHLNENQSVPALRLNLNLIRRIQFNVNLWAMYSLKNITVSWYVEPSSPKVTNVSVKREASIFRLFSEDEGSMFFLNVDKQSVKSHHI
jgi:hypothetical protein